MNQDIKLGYEFASHDEEGKLKNPDTVGSVVTIKPSHLASTGITQLSGKTTTLEAVIIRGIQGGIIKQAIVFKTKVGETGFTQGMTIPPYFKEKTDWQYVSSLLEATLKEKLKFERAWIIRICRNAESLTEIRHNIDTELSGRLSQLSRNVFTTLAAYLDLVLPQLQFASFSRTLDIQKGQINIMDLERFSEEIQSLVIRSVLETVLKEHKDTIVVMPEAWKFSPQGRGNPCKLATAQFIRQGATNGNYLMVDAQDMAGVDKQPLKQVSTWIMGLQMERNEVKHTLDQIPLPKNRKPKEDQIMTLKVGHFILSTPEKTVGVYVQPAWLDDETAKKVALGEIDVSTLKQPEAQIGVPVGSPLALVPLDIKAAQFYARVREDIVQLRNDFFTKIQTVKTDQDARIDALGKGLSQLEAKIRDAVNIDEIVSLVLQKMPASQTLNIEEITQEVLKRIPRTAGSVTYTVPPLEKLSKDFLQAAKDQIISEVSQLDPEQKKILKFTESLQRHTNVSEVMEKAFFLKPTGGGRSRLTKKLAAMASMEFVRKDEKSRYFPNLKAKITGLLEIHQGTPEEIEAVYNHVLMEMIQ